MTLADLDRSHASPVSRRYGKLSGAMADLLLDHIQGPQAVDVNDHPRHIRLLALIRHKLVRFRTSPLPRQTVITSAGRETASEILAREADWLSEAIV